MNTTNDISVSSKPHRMGLLTMIVAFLPMVCCAGAGATIVGGCGPKSEAAFADLASKKTTCVLQNLDRTPEQMLIDCAIPKDSKEVQDYIDIFTSAQAGAKNAGAPLPHAGTGYLPKLDGGAK